MSGTSLTFQSGYTESDLTGLKGLAEVDFFEQEGFTTYVIDGLTLNIEGNLTQLSNEYIQFENENSLYLTITNNGHFTVQGIITNETESDKMGIPQILSTRQALRSWQQTYGLVVNTGTLKFEGGYIKANAAINLLNSDSYFITENGAFE